MQDLGFQHLQLGSDHHNSSSDLCRPPGEAAQSKMESSPFKDTGVGMEGSAWQRGGLIRVVL